jgi:hypothetical protein
MGDKSWERGEGPMGDKSWAALQVLAERVTCRRSEMIEGDEREEGDEFWRPA